MIGCLNLNSLNDFVISIKHLRYSFIYCNGCWFWQFYHCSPLKKCPGVRAKATSSSFEIDVIGHGFKMASIWVNSCQINSCQLCSSNDAIHMTLQWLDCCIEKLHADFLLCFSNQQFRNWRQLRNENWKFSVDSVR